MKDIIIVDGNELKGLLDWLKFCVTADPDSIYQLRVCVDSGAAKFKFNSATWSPPYGRLEDKH